MNFGDMSSNERLKSLNHSQLEAVTQQDGSMLVLAGAGSGKTRVLTERIVHIINEGGAEPSRIMAVTFTNKAAREMNERLRKVLNPEVCQKVWIGTFHSICNRILRTDIDNVIIDGKNWSRNFVILDAAESLSAIKDVANAMNLDEKMYPPRSISSFIGGLKNRGIMPSEFLMNSGDARESLWGQVYARYVAKNHLSNALDFDDLLLFVLHLFRTNLERCNYYHDRFRHILVDEFQDTNETQYSLLKSIVLGPTGQRDWTDRSFCAVGDIDQSIYSWRGANYRLALNLRKDFPETNLIKLEYNYRSAGSILQLANSVITNNKQRIEKNLICTRGEGHKISCFEAADEVEEADYLAGEIEQLVRDGRATYDDITVLYRINAQSRALEDSLRRRRIPYAIFGGIKFYERLEIKDLIAYLRLIHNPKDSHALKRIINRPKRGIGATTLAQIETKADEVGLSLYAALSDLVDSGDLQTKITEAVHSFIELIESLSEQANTCSLPELLKHTINRSGYVKALETSKEDEQEVEGRIENIYELVNVAQQFEEESDDKSLAAFLSRIALVGEADDDSPEGKSVSLMTVHSSKGLEFPIVFITGLEEGVFPHIRSINSGSEDELEEERRLLYVAITRAAERLYLTYARRRRLWGSRDYAQPSRFLGEMPRELLLGYWGASSSRGASPDGPARSKTSAEEQHSSLAVGDRVKHANFGCGLITGTFGGKNQKFYAVEFDGADGKKLLNASSLQKI